MAESPLVGTEGLVGVESAEASWVHELAGQLAEQLAEQLADVPVEELAGGLLVVVAELVELGEGA